MPPTTQASVEAFGARGAGGAMASLPPTTSQTELSFAKREAPASQPAQAVAEAEQPLDVVIVVQSAAAATQPAATQPASPAPANAEPPQTQPARSSNP
jgi:hypothetical protein